MAQPGVRADAPGSPLYFAFHRAARRSTYALGLTLQMATEYRYRLTPELVTQALELEEFANGGIQCHVRLKDGSVHSGVLISNGTAIIAMRGRTELPFAVLEIAEFYQTGDDCSPQQRGGWQFFDVWKL